MGDIHKADRFHKRAKRRDPPHKRRGRRVHRAGGFIDISATGEKSKAISIDGVFYYSGGQMTCSIDAAGGTVQI